MAIEEHLERSRISVAHAQHEVLVGKLLDVLAVAEHPVSHTQPRPSWITKDPR